jgi:hypothetical protein
MQFSMHEKAGVVILRLEGKVVGGPDATALSETIHEAIDAGKTRFLVDMAKVLVS